MSAAAAAVLVAAAVATPRLALFEPCAQSAGLPSARELAAALARERGVVFEALPPGWDGWMELQRRPPDVLYLHTVGTLDAVAVVCFDDLRSRERAWYRALAQGDAPTWRRGTYVRTSPSPRQTWWVGLQRQALADVLDRPDGTTYLRIDTLEPGTVDDPAEVAASGWPPLRQRIASLLFLDRALAAVPNALVPVVTSVPELVAESEASAGPRVERVVLPHLRAPSAADLGAGEAVEVQAEDPWKEPVHLEAVLPHGFEWEATGPQAGRILCCSDGPDPGATDAVLVAWSGPDRDRARHTVHHLRLRRRADDPLPALPRWIWGSTASALALGVVLDRVDAWRRRR